MLECITHSEIYSSNLLDEYTEFKDIWEDRHHNRWKMHLPVEIEYICSLLHKHYVNKSRIRIVDDIDFDGVSSATVSMNYLKPLFTNVDVYSTIEHGINQEIIRGSSSIDLLIIVDGGTNLEEVLKDLECDVWSRNLKENTNYISTNGDRQYTGILPIPDTLDYLEYTEDYMDGIYDGLVDFKVQITAQTSWGSEYTWYPDESMVPPGENNGYLTRFKTKQYDIKVQSIQLYDFHVTDITDRSTIFKTDVYVRNLPSSVQSSLVDDISETDNIAILKGYGFYFELWSRGLKKTGDHIVIEPKFYALKDLSGEIQKNADGSLVELTGYVKDSQQNYVDFTTAGTNTPEPLYWDSDRYISLGTHDRINIPIDLRTIKGSSQCWTGRYGVPADSQFFRKNANPLQDNPYSGYILVVFDVKAYRKSINQDGILQDREKYQYVLKRQWKRERELSPDKSILKSDFYTHEEDWRSEGYNYGTVAIFDSKRRLVDDYVVEPVWGQ